MIFEKIRRLFIENFQTKNQVSHTSKKTLSRSTRLITDINQVSICKKQI